MSGALAQIWGMINGMQMMIHLSCTAVNFPANASVVVDKILMIAGFDIPFLNMDDIFGRMDAWNLGSNPDQFLNDLPHNTQLLSSLDMVGYSSR
jgi:hypothetical protein